MSRRVVDLSREEKELIALGSVGEVAGLPTLVYTDGPNGVRDAPGATMFPSALTLAASFDLKLAADYGRALGDEVRAAGRNVLLGPTADVLRVPWNGRAGESFGEDPLLSGEMAGAVAGAVQSRGVLAVLKHFVANNFERLRTGSGSFERRTPAVDVVVSERALREIYLEPFRRAITASGVGGLMASYNRLGGDYVAQTTEILDLPRREWGFTGATFPDFLFAVRDPAAALRAGLDIPGLDGPSGRAAADVAALPDGRLDAIASHVLSAVEALEPASYARKAPSLGSSEARALAQGIATSGAILLANDGTLPLAHGARVALISPDSVAHLAVVGGSAAVGWPTERVASLREALQSEGLIVDSVDAGDADVPLVPVASTDLIGGAQAIVRDALTGREVTLDLEVVELHDVPQEIGEEWSAAVELVFDAPRPGLYRFSLDVAGDATLTVGSSTVSGYREASPMIGGPAYPLQAWVESSGGRVAISIDYESAAALNVPPLGFRPGFRLGWSEVSASIAEAAEAARHAEVAIVVVGRATGEAMDADSLHLPGVQEQVIAAVAGANRRTVVVVGGSGPVVMPWRDTAAAILHLGQAGEQFGPALAALVRGSSEPGGRLPFTIPAHEFDVPVTTRGYPGVDGVVYYDEELLIGYRGYEAAETHPAFSFGHGLGYTTFDIHAPQVAVSKGRLVVSGVAQNLGSRLGKFVPQVYVTSLDGTSPRALRGFAALHVAPGAVHLFDISIDLGDLREFDPASHTWVNPSRFLVELCSSSNTVLWSTETLL